MLAASCCLKTNLFSLLLEDISEFWHRNSSCSKSFKVTLPLCIPASVSEELFDAWNRSCSLSCVPLPSFLGCPSLFQALLVLCGLAMLVTLLSALQGTYIAMTRVTRYIFGAAVVHSFAGHRWQDISETQKYNGDALGAPCTPSGLGLYQSVKALFAARGLSLTMLD